jgi:excisionase family DNA binding protein
MAENEEDRLVESPVGQVLTTAQVAKFLQISPRTVQRAIRTGELKAHRIRRVYRVNAQDMREWWDKIAFVPPPKKEEVEPTAPQKVQRRVRQQKR